MIRLKAKKGVGCQVHLSEKSNFQGVSLRCSNVSKVRYPTLALGLTWNITIHQTSL